MRQVETKLQGSHYDVEAFVLDLLCIATVFRVVFILTCVRKGCFWHLVAGCCIILDLGLKLR
jgi:hypothetical protein